MQERIPECSFETSGAFCEIAQGGENCHLLNICIEANAHPGEDITPTQFCEMNPSLKMTIDQALLLRKAHLRNVPQSKTPLRDCHERLRMLPTVYHKIVIDNLPNSRP